MCKSVSIGRCCVYWRAASCSRYSVTVCGILHTRYRRHPVLVQYLSPFTFFSNRTSWRPLPLFSITSFHNLASHEWTKYYLSASPSSRTKALGSTQPLTEMSTRIFPGGKGGRCVGLTTFSPSCADCLKIWEPWPLGSSGPVKACNGIALALPLPIACRPSTYVSTLGLRSRKLSTFTELGNFVTHIF
jgi:hypothetical protein